MNASLSFKLSMIVLIGLNGLAAYWILNVWSASAPMLLDASPSSNNPSPSKIEKRATQPPYAKPLQAYDQILARPVFIRSRAPWAAPPPPPPPAAVEPKEPAPSEPEPTRLDFKLLGIVASGRVAKIFMVEPGQSDGQWVSKGESVEGWVLTKVDAVSATFKRGQTVVKLELFSQEEEEGSSERSNKKRAPHG